MNSNYRGPGGAFPGFPPEAMSFFRGLKRNNRREWFQARKHIFEEKVRAPMAALVEALNAAMMKFAPDYVTDPRDAIYRIYRDTRFSPDKRPYKDHIAAVFTRRGLTKHACGGFYFSVAPDEVEVAGGIYMPGPEELRAIRGHLVANHEELRRRLRSLRALMGELWSGDPLSRVPKGFPSDHAASDLIRCRRWTLYVTLAPELATTPRLFPEILKRFRAMTPFVEFLNAPLVAARREQAARTFLL